MRPVLGKRPSCELGAVRKLWDAGVRVSGGDPGLCAWVRGPETSRHVALGCLVAGVGVPWPWSLFSDLKVSDGLGSGPAWALLGAPRTHYGGLRPRWSVEAARWPLGLGEGSEPRFLWAGRAGGGAGCWPVYPGPKHPADLRGPRALGQVGEPLSALPLPGSSLSCLTIPSSLPCAWHGAQQ